MDEGADPDSPRIPGRSFDPVFFGVQDRAEGGRGFGIHLSGGGEIGRVVRFAVHQEDDGAVGSPGHEIQESVLGIGGADGGELVFDPGVVAVVEVGGRAFQHPGAVGIDGHGGDAGLLQQLEAEGPVGAETGHQGGGGDERGDGGGRQEAAGCEEAAEVHGAGSALG